MSLRRVHVCIEYLLSMPGGSALARAIDPKTEWSTTNYLIAELIDRLDLANYLTYKANFESEETPDSKRMEMPDPFPRPGQVKDEKVIEFASYEEVAQALELNF